MIQKQILKDTVRSTVIKLVGTGADADQVVVQANTLFGALNTTKTYLKDGGVALPYYGTSFYRVWYDVSSNAGGRVTLSWKTSSGKTPIITMALNGTYNEEGNWLVIENPDKAISNGDIILDAVNVNGYTIIFEIVKDHIYFDSGEVSNPELFNYGPYGITP